MVVLYINTAFYIYTGLNIVILKWCCHHHILCMVKKAFIWMEQMEKPT